MSVVADVQSYLAAAGIVDGSSGWTSIRRKLVDSIGPVVVIREDGGAPPEIGRDSGMGDAAFRDVGVHITVRADEGEGDDGADKAWEIFDALHGLTAVSMGSGYYDRVLALTGGPVLDEWDSNDRPRHTIAFRCATSQGAPA